MVTIRIVQGDITEVQADAVVNAANNRMRGGGGVDGAIHRVGGPTVLADCIERFPDGLATGDAGWTTAGNLPAQHVIHTVAPNLHAGESDTALMRSCYRRSLEVADALGARSVAFPLLGTGAYGWEFRSAAELAIREVLDSNTRVAEVLFVAHTDADFDTLQEVAEGYLQ